MKGLASGRVSYDLRVNSRAAITGALVIFENKHPRTFSDRKTIAISRERPRRALGSMIPRLCQRAQQRVSLDNSRRNRRVNAAHQKHRLHTGLNVLIGVANRVGRRSAARRYHVAVPAETKSHAE